MYPKKLIEIKRIGYTIGTMTNRIRPAALTGASSSEAILGILNISPTIPTAAKKAIGSKTKIGDIKEAFIIFGFSSMLPISTSE